MFLLRVLRDFMYFVICNLFHINSLYQGYPCCEDQNIQIVYTDENGGLWGVENGYWCSIINTQHTTTIISYQTIKLLILTIHLYGYIILI